MINFDNFNPDDFGTFKELQRGGKTGVCDILMIACSDHGTAPDNISFVHPSRLYIVQNLAASIPPIGETLGESTLGSIEYAVCLMQVRHIIVCGHLGCKILPNLQRLGWGDERNIKISSAHLTAQTSVSELGTRARVREQMQAMIEEHLLQQLDNLLSHTFIQERLREGRLRLHGWLVNDRTARIRSFDPGAGEFVPLESVGS